MGRSRKVVLVSAAHGCATAKGRAGVAARLIRQAAARRWKRWAQNENPFPRGGRSFDDCFECGDGGEVVHFLRRKVLEDPELAADVRALGRYMPPVVLEAAEAGTAAPGLFQ